MAVGALEEERMEEAVEDSASKTLADVLTDFEPDSRPFLRALLVFKAANPFLKKFDQSQEMHLLEKLCRYIVFHSANIMGLHFSIMK